MNLILLCVCSILVGRYFEKKMKVASIAHSVLFIVMAFFFLFNSGFRMIDTAMINMFGQEAFDQIHEALTYASTIYGITMSSLFLMEIYVYLGLCVVAIVAVIKGFRKLFHKIKTHQLVLFKDGIANNTYPTNDLLTNYQETYLVYAHLRN